jgi:glycine/D-amino acid oxidase-like deaminating enzyme
MEEVDILIVGGGVAGLATAWELGSREVSGVVLLEREGMLGTQSSARNAAILRTVGADPVMTTLAQRGMARLQDPPERFAEVPLIDPVGFVLVADEATAGALRHWVYEAGPRSGAREIPAARLRERVPLLAAEPVAAFQFPDEGCLAIAALMQGFARGARRRGIDLRTGCRVERLRREAGAIRGAHLAGGGEIRARVTVVAAGGWAGILGTSAGSRVPFRPTRRHLMVTAPDPGIDPRWPVVWLLGDEFYCRPESGGMLVCACDQIDVEPDRCDVDPDVCEVLAGKTARHLPALAEARAARVWCGMRTLTADGRFAIGPDPDLEGLFWVAGLGGHGMTCAFEVGRIAAARLVGEEPGEAGWEALDPARLVPRTPSTARRQA